MFDPGSRFSWKDKALFTPGPLTTSRRVKQAMLRDLGSRDQEFIHTVGDLRARLVSLAGADPQDFRIGHIGRLVPADCHALLAAVRDALAEMDLPPGPSERTRR